MKRRRRWEQRRPNVRPARARRGRWMVSEDDAVTAYELGFHAGMAEESRARDALHRIAEAIRNDSIDELRAELDGEHLVGEIEDWLDEHGGDS